MRFTLLPVVAAVLLLSAPGLRAAPALLDESGLRTERFGQLRIAADDGNQLTAYTYRSTTFDSNNGPIWFVIHGTLRDADYYLEQAAPLAERYNAFAVAIEFPESLYSSFTFNEALYSTIENVYSEINASIGGEAFGYYLYGHSAGAQFTHRLLTFNPDARVMGAVAANAGWYTLPNLELAEPYGLGGTGTTEAELAKLLHQPLTILAGEFDIGTPEQDSNVRGRAGAMAQGENRRQRAEVYFNEGRIQGTSAGVAPGHNWQFNVVPKTDHTSSQMINSAAAFLFDSGVACRDPETTGNIIFTEILADPADGLDGDANRDGIGDASDDEFIRLSNAGSQAVCLSGWTLSDVSKTRFVFPLGETLRPGESILVFGGGQPTGDFAGQVWTVPGERTLGLSNSGDVITLRNVAGVIEQQVSWGSCADASCADDHIDGSLSINRSVKFINGSWQ